MTKQESILELVRMLREAQWKLETACGLFWQLGDENRYDEAMRLVAAVNALACNLPRDPRWS